jgi:predicted nucleotidyltransferase
MDLVPRGLRDTDRAFLDRLVYRADDDERVTALILGGSHAAGTADEHSDLDLYLITRDDAFDSFRHERHEFMHRLGDAVFLEEHENFGFLMLLFMYSDGVRGEIAVTPARDVSEVHAGPHITLLDKDGVMHGRQFPVRPINAEDRRAIAANMLIWFWYDRWLLDVALARGTLWTAHYYLERCRQACVDLGRLRARPDLWPGGYEKAEHVIDAATLDTLASTVVALEADAMRNAAASVTQIYLELGRQVADLYGVEFPDRLVTTVTAHLNSK